MSRGIGRTQREAMLALRDHEDGAAAGVPLTELKRAISSDRSNARRALRGLIERGLLEEVTDEEGVRRVKLAGGAHLALWLAAYPDGQLTIDTVPSRPLDLDLGDDLDLEDDDTPLSLWQPHVSSPPPPDRGVNDNAPSTPERGDPTRTGACHANAPPPPDRGVSDNGTDSTVRGDPMDARTPHGDTPPTLDRGVNDNAPYRPGLGLEIAARMAREILERLDEEERA